MKIRWLFALIVVLGFCCPCYAAVYEPVAGGYGNFAVVDCPKFLNIRKRPDAKSEVVGLIKNGGAVDVLQEGDEWCAIKSGDISGYVLKEYLLFDADATDRAIEFVSKKIRFKSAGVIYSEPSLETARIWTKIVPGAVYDVIEDREDWIVVDMMGASGYVYASDAITRFYGLDTATHTYSVKNVSDERSRIVKYAVSFLGNPYLWGGNDPHTGADCSGFVKYVYNKFRPDIKLPRVSYEQCYCGESISSLDMKPGDLLFYANTDGTVHHVAMYIGNGTIVHAASARLGIILSPWNYQIPKYIRRFLN